MPTPDARRTPGHLIATLREGARQLFPGYFGLVMATGVISIACDMLGMRVVALLLVAVNWVAYPVLCLLTLIRVLRFRDLLVQDIFDHQRSPGFFTLVAGTCVLGTQSMIVLGARDLAIGLWWLGLGLWFVVMYTFLTAVTVRDHKPTLGRGINGAWLIACVATQSVVVLSAAINVETPPHVLIEFQVISMFLIGAMLYLAIIPLIFYRLTFVDLTYSEFGPPYWINMGAVAISALAGSLLMQRSEVWPLIDPLLPFIRGLTYFFWAVASWWIPFLFALTTWRYLWKHDRFRYEPAVWGMVFPLGMYTASTLQFDHAMGYDFLDPIPGVLIFIALAAWTLAILGLLRRLTQMLLAVQR